MKLRVLILLAFAVVIAFVFLYLLQSYRGTGTELGLVNSVGLATFVIGIIAAGMILRRASPPG